MKIEDLNALSYEIIGCSYAVHTKLGCGFLEKVYENALCIEFVKKGLKFETQKPVSVVYDNQIVGEFTPDILVDNRIVVELKSVNALTDIHYAQCINYLKATGLPLCLLINFGEKQTKIKRFANLSNTTPSVMSVASVAEK